MEKINGADAAMSAHIERTTRPKDADADRAYLNQELISFPGGIENRTQAIQCRLNTAGLTRETGNNQMKAIRILFTGICEDMGCITNDGRFDGWCSSNLKYFADTFDRENIVSAVLHMNEQAPHIYTTLVPIVRGERKRKKKEEQAKRRHRKKPIDAVRLCANDIMTRTRLKSYQDTYAQATSRYGLQCGIDGSEAKHISTRQYCCDLVQRTEQLQTDTEQLQDHREMAQEELRRAKREIQTEKLEDVAVTAAASIAESVDSLFGDDEVRTLERENRNLHERIFEPEEEARQRGRRQTKRIQEITDAYEQRHRELLGFVSFVKRYLPCVEKLMPTVKFSHDTLNFGDGFVRKLCAFKDVSTKGDLCLPELRQHFKADDAVCSLRQNTEGSFDFKTDGVSYVGWFRHRKDEFMEVLGLPIRK